MYIALNFVIFNFVNTLYLAFLIWPSWMPNIWVVSSLHFDLITQITKKKHAKLGLAPKMVGIFGITFLRCTLSLTKVSLYLKFSVFILIKQSCLISENFVWTFTTGWRNFGGVSQKVIGAKKNFSMLVQDSLPIDTTISKC
jgi:hypothetical protein